MVCVLHKKWYNVTDVSYFLLTVYIYMHIIISYRLGIIVCYYCRPGRILFLTDCIHI